MSETVVVKGFKVFHADWTCSPNGITKHYTCPGRFEENVVPSVCDVGMHFCRKAADCFNYYKFNPKYKVAEVIAYGDIAEEGDKCCTNKLEIVREIPWAELLEIVNTGKCCTGLYNSGNRNSGDCNSGNWNSGNRNSGDCNSGNWNSGNRNSGDYNSGNGNTGDWNTGTRNSGDCNSGNENTGDWNTGNRNSGDCNSGTRNSGDCNSGNWNSGNRNSGDYNSGNRNSGDCNSGNRNSGNWNSGDYNSGNRNSGNWNSGDWNKCSFSNGCFNTNTPKIYLFNHPSEWTYEDWLNSEACRIINRIQGGELEYIRFSDMTDEERAAHPEAETTGGYVKPLDTSECAVNWWRGLSEREKAIITAIPNFDKVIFKEITGVDVDL